VSGGRTGGEAEETDERVGSGWAGWVAAKRCTGSNEIEMWSRWGISSTEDPSVELEAFDSNHRNNKLCPFHDRTHAVFSLNRARTTTLGTPSPSEAPCVNKLLANILKECDDIKSHICMQSQCGCPQPSLSRTQNRKPRKKESSVDIQTDM
jgi:hypothetical protein